MDGWMDGWKGGWWRVDGWMNGWMDGWVGDWVIGYTDRETDRQMFDSRQGQEMSLLQRLQTASGAHPASYSMVPSSVSPTMKPPVCDADH
jgi:hypothetical protein